MDADDQPERPPDGEQFATDHVTDHWEAVVADMEATAAEYEERGWDAVELHPGDVTAVDGDDRWGLDVLVPDNEFPEARAAVENGTFDSFQVFRAAAGGVVFAVVAMEDERREVAVLVPVHFDPQSDSDVLRRARTEGSLPVHLRRLQPEPVVSFVLDDPSPLLEGD